MIFQLKAAHQATSPQLEDISGGNWVKSFLGCRIGKACSDIPGVCIVLQMILVVAIFGVLAYLFVTQEILG